MANKVIVGVAGSGKTSFSMDIIEREIRNGLKWTQIGFASFSKAACAEAAERASKITGEDMARLQRDGWMRTIHSCALRGLGIDTKCVLDNDSVDGEKFLLECLGSKRGGEPGTLAAEVDDILNAWDHVRARLTLLDDADDGKDLSGTSGMAPGQLNGDMGQTNPSGDTRGQTHSALCPGTQTLCSTEVAPSRDRQKPVYPYREKIISEITNESVCEILSVPLSRRSVNSYIGKDLRPGQTDRGMCPSLSRVGARVGEMKAIGKIEKNRQLIQTYERSKRLYGRLDFTDILMSFAGVQVRDDLTFVQVYPNGQVPEEVEVWMFDEFQDASPLLGMVAERLSEAARDVYWLGDRYQTVYGFSGASAAVFAAKEDQAKAEGNRILLNRSWRNPEQVLEWGEEILREDGGYDEREPISEATDGSVGLMDSVEFESVLPLLAGSDTMILARTWFALSRIKAKLDEQQIPWRSCQEKTSSRWECPSKIAYTLVMRELMAGQRISEQDFRRITETLPQKWHGRELFARGVKAKWKKAECSGAPQKTLEQLPDWGVTPEFLDFVREGKWRVDMPLLLDIAIDKHGIDEVRDPSIRIGSVHSVKGMQARNVFCLSASTGRIERDCEESEELCLKYVAVTRTSKHYRLVVDQMDIARSRPLFWAAPRNCTDWKGFDDAGKRHSDSDPEMVQDEWNLGGEGEWRDVRDDRDA